MTRSEEIKEARHKWYLRTQDADFCAGFQKGAEWADQNPDIDVRTMAAWRGGYKEAIEKACEWLERALPLRPDDRDEFIEQFKEAMKGE